MNATVPDGTTYAGQYFQITSDTTYSTSDPRRGTSTGIGFISNQTFTSGKCLRNCGGNFAVALPER